MQWYLFENHVNEWYRLSSPFGEWVSGQVISKDDRWERGRANECCQILDLEPYTDRMCEFAVR